MMDLNKVLPPSVLVKHITPTAEGWFPVCLEDDVPGKSPNSRRPFSFRLLGEPLILYYDCSTSQIICIADKCPHRSAQLSLGTITETGAIECAYHGWKFRGNTGLASSLPGCSSTGLKDYSSDLMRLETDTRHGCVWVRSRNAPIDAMIPTIVNFVDARKFTRVYDVSVEAPVEHHLLMDNFFDAAHLPFAHDGSFSWKSDVLDGATMEVIPTQFGLEGKCHILSRGRRGTYHVWWHPPYFVEAVVDIGWGSHIIYASAIPSGPTTCRLVFQAFLPNSLLLSIPGVVPFAREMYYRAGAQDLQMLSSQSRRIAEGAHSHNKPSLYCDRMVMAHGAWLAKAFGVKYDRPWWKGYSGTLDVEDLKYYVREAAGLHCDSIANPDAKPGAGSLEQRLINDPNAWKYVMLNKKNEQQKRRMGGTHPGLANLSEALIHTKPDKFLLWTSTVAIASVMSAAIVIMYMRVIPKGAL